MEIVTEPVDPDRRAGPPLRRGAAAPAADDRRVGRRHGARPDAGRGERLAPAAGHGTVRDPGRGQEHELVPVGRAGDRLRDRAPGGRARRRRGRSPRRPAAGTTAGGVDVRHAARRRSPTTTATSPSRTCRRCASTRPGSRRSGRACPSCRPRAGRATSTSSACRPTTPAVIVAQPRHRARLRGDPRRRPGRAGQGGRQLRDRRLRPGGQRDGRADRGRPRRAGRRRGRWPTCSARIVAGRAVADECAGGVRDPPRDRPARGGRSSAERGFRQIRDSAAPRGGDRRRSWRRTRRRSPTTTPASRRSASSSAR